MTPERFAGFIQDLADTAASRSDVVGLVGFGSTADRARADEGSDHDFAWVTVPGAEDRYRHDLAWLPDHDRISLSVIEWHGGVKVIYDDGHRLEFGIADLSGFSTWVGAPAKVIVGDERVHEAVAVVVANRPQGKAEPDAELVLFHTQLLAGIGRARRGERASAAGLIRGEAVDHLLRVVAALLPSQVPESSRRLDPLDPRRRFDAAYPELADAIEAACRLDPISSAEALLDLAQTALQSTGQYPADGARIVRERLRA
jgi:hypothetical protein